MRVVRLAFALVLLVTLVSLLTPGDQILAVKVWVASWLPFAGVIDRANIAQDSDKLVHATLFATMG